MNPTPALPEVASGFSPKERLGGTNKLRRSFAHAAVRASWLPLLALPAAAWCITRGAPAWANMAAIAGTEFFAVKLLTLRERLAGQTVGRVFAYIFLWPGLNPGEFFGPAPARPRANVTYYVTIPTAGTTERAEFLAGVRGLLAGIALALFALCLPTTSVDPWLRGWIGMFAIVFAWHFGVLQLTACAWCRAGVTVRPIMRHPLRATSLTDFWSERWNAAFADCARRFVFRPVARRLGLAAGGAAVFLLSGLIHETVISLPARGGWGGPTLYFALQGVGVAVERLNPIRRWLGWRKHRGWLWTFAFTALPLPLLFHRAFAERVIAPLFGLHFHP